MVDLSLDQIGDNSQGHQPISCGQSDEGIIVQPYTFKNGRGSE
mgnify:CR=1 FL=1